MAGPRRPPVAQRPARHVLALQLDASAGALRRAVRGGRDPGRVTAALVDEFRDDSLAIMTTGGGREDLSTVHETTSPAEMLRPGGDVAGDDRSLHHRGGIGAAKGVRVPGA